MKKDEVWCEIVVLLLLFEFTKNLSVRESEPRMGAAATFTAAIHTEEDLPQGICIGEK